MSKLLFKAWSLITVEPIVFLVSFSVGLMEAPNMWLYFEKVSLHSQVFIYNLKGKYSNYLLLSKLTTVWLSKACSSNTKRI